jgi:hypothetical protein
LSGFPPQLTLTLTSSADGRPHLVLTAPGDPGEPDLVYRFAPVGATATPPP